MTVHPVTSAIAMQFRQQRRILFRKFVRLLYRTSELVGIERQTLVGSVDRRSIRLSTSPATAMTRDTYRAMRTVIFY